MPSDAVSHTASKDLATLLEYQVITPSEDGLLHPDAELTLGDWLLMMTSGVSPGSIYYGGVQKSPYTDVPADSPYASAVQMFMDRGWLGEVNQTELHPEQKLTREMLATSLTEILKYNRLAAFFQNDVAISALSDASSIKDKGAVALVIKMGLIKATDGKFEPNRPVTKAEVASIMVLLAHLQGKMDNPIAGR